jgi:SdrD B-like protein
MSRTWIRVSIALFVVGTFCAERSSACSCVKIPRPANCANLKPIGPSFVGTVIDIENPPDERRFADQSGLSRYRFRIDENVSGFEEKEVDIYSGRGGGDCSYHFRMGESYFVTPFRENEFRVPYRAKVPSEKLMAGICTETQPTASATALLKELRARKRGGATVVGLLRTESGADDYNHRIPDATVELRIDNTTLSTQTDIDGVYQFNGVPAGTYQFAVKLPADFQVAANASGSLPSITITDQPCYTKDIYAAQMVPTRSP